MHREPAISVFMPVHDAAAYLAFVHATIMFRRALFLEIGGYRSECTVWDDMDLCRRLAARGRVMVLPAALYRYRFHPDSTTLRRSGTDLSVVTERMYEQLAPSRRDGRSGRSGPRAETFYYVGALRLWAGVAPAFTGRLRDLPWLPPTVAGLKLLLLATWGRWSPGSLRAVLRGSIALRDRLAGPFLAGEAPVEWRCE